MLKYYKNYNQNKKIMNAITIELGNVGSKEQALRISEKLNGKTYYNFQVDYSVYMGNYPASVTTFYKGATVKEVTSMLMFLMACEL